MFLSYVFQSILINIMIYTKITHLCLNISRWKRTNLGTANVTCCKIKDSANLHPSSCRIYATKRTRSSTTSIHRVLLFDQLPWLKNYINFYNRQRKAAKNDFEKDFFKLINNAVFSKSFICLFVLFY